MYSEDQLIHNVIKGEAKAIRHLLTEYQHYIFTICNTVLKNKEESEEATQDAFIKIIKALPTYVKKGKLTTWMYSVAYRTALDYLKKRKVTQELNGYDMAAQSDIEKAIFRAEDKKAVNRLLDMIPPEDAGLIRMYYLEEMSMNELASHVGLSVSNVKVKIYRTRKQLAELIRRNNLLTDFQYAE